MKGAGALAAIIIVIATLALVAKAKEPPVKPVPPVEPILPPEPPPPEPVPPPAPPEPRPTANVGWKVARGGETIVAGDYWPPKTVITVTSPELFDTFTMTAGAGGSVSRRVRIRHDAPLGEHTVTLTGAGYTATAETIVFDPEQPQPVATWRWHDEPATGQLLLNPRTGQIVIGLPTHKAAALFKANWTSPTHRQLREAEVRYRAPGVPRIPEEYLPPRLPRPVPPPRLPRPRPPGELPPPPAPIPVATWQWHDEPRRGLVVMNPKTGQIVRGLPAPKVRALRRAGWVLPSSRQLDEAERRYRAPGVPRIPEVYLPPGWPEIPGLPPEPVPPPRPPRRVLPPPGVPRIPGIYQPPGWPEIPGLPEPV